MLNLSCWDHFAQASPYSLQPVCCYKGLTQPLPSAFAYKQLIMETGGESPRVCTPLLIN